LKELIMDVLEDVPNTYDQAVRTLAAWHGEEQDPPVEIYHFPDPQGRTIRFVEVSYIFPSTGKVAPVTMGASVEFPFRSSVALVSPEEWKAVLDGTISLPEGWKREDMAKVWPHE
jgi:hypothetical protein